MIMMTDGIIKNDGLCPRCLEIRLETALDQNALSRRDNNTYICSKCDTGEVLRDLGYSDSASDARELNMENWIAVEEAIQKFIGKLQLRVEVLITTMS